LVFDGTIRAAAELNDYLKGRAKSMEAMIIDDSRVTRMVLGQILKKLGFTVTEANGGEEALARLKDGLKPCLALVDRNMPGMDGLAVISAVRADPDLRNLSLLLVTGEDDDAVIQESFAAGAAGFLHKPFSFEQVQEKLKCLGILTGC
jgi:two-component system, chemotaxis family, chemotaxis protein CheY